MATARISVPSRTRCVWLFITAAVLCHPHGVWAVSPTVDPAFESLSTIRMVEDIRTLSAPSFHGRQAGTEDDLRSAQWIAQAFLSAGLHLPRISNGTLPFPFPAEENGSPLGLMASLIPHSSISPEPALRIGPAEGLSTVTLEQDYLPVFDSPTAAVQGPVVFVGYGIVDPSQGINDYAGIDVTGSIVLFLRGKPEHASRPVSHADKVRMARERGALAYLTATGPLLHPYEVRRGVTGTPVAFYSQLAAEQAIPGAWISTAVAEQLLTEEGEGSDPHRLRTLQERLNRAPSTGTVRTNRYASLHWKTTTREGLMTNVVGLIPGTGPDTVLVGAHRDHFGRPAGLLFPGADDNASGTAVMLEVARALANKGWRPRRTILFVSFSGEENDLRGSRLYVSRPVVPLGSTNVMINIDHAGIGNGRLTVGVTGADKRIAMEAGQSAGCPDKVDVFGFFPGGDHVPFKEAGIPTVTVVSGGIHPHFHQPTDTADTLEPDVLQTVARYVFALTRQLADAP